MTELKVKLDVYFECYTYEDDCLDRYISHWGVLYDWSIGDFCKYRRDMRANKFEPLNDMITQLEEVFKSVGLKQDKDFKITLNTKVEDDEYPDVQLIILNRDKLFKLFVKINDKIKKLRNSYVTVEPMILQNFIDTKRLFNDIFTLFIDYYLPEEQSIACPFRDNVREYIENQVEEISPGNNDWIYYDNESHGIDGLIWKCCNTLINFGYLEKTESDSQVNILTDCTDINADNYQKEAPKYKEKVTA
jgi:hypothetical protein